jgi:hypothetical protein
MKKITSFKDIKVGDKILLETEEEGVVLKKDEGHIYGKVFSYVETVKRIDPSSIISLHRGGNFFMVEI